MRVELVAARHQSTDVEVLGAGNLDSAQLDELVLRLGDGDVLIDGQPYGADLEAESKRGPQVRAGQIVRVIVVERMRRG